MLIQNLLHSSQSQYLLTQAFHKPGAILGPIARVLGYLCNFLFDIVSAVIIHGSLGLTIILFTIVIRIILFPLSIKQQKSMVAMRKLQPEVDKINKKYKDNKDPEVKQKQSMEMSELYRKNKVTPLSGCLPLLVQMPILMALYYVIREGYDYINHIGDIYVALGHLLGQIPGLPLVYNKADVTFSQLNPADIKMIIYQFTKENWAAVIAAAPQDIGTQITSLLQQKNSIETFLTINLMDKSGYGLPGILIPILAGGATFLSTWIMNKNNAMANSNPQLQMQQKMMLYIMPVMMGVMAVPMPAGLGIYWIMSSLTQLCQQLVLNKIYPYETKEDKEKRLLKEQSEPKPTTGNKKGARS